MGSRGQSWVKDKRWWLGLGLRSEKRRAGVFLSFTSRLAYFLSRLSATHAMAALRRGVVRREQHGGRQRY